MNKTIIAVAVLILLGLGYYFLTAEENSSNLVAITTAETAKEAASVLDTPSKEGTTNQQEPATTAESLENFYDEEIVPADQLYKSAQEAYDSVLAGAKDYNDIILEQFANLEDCSFCPELYQSLKETMLDSEDEDVKGYIAELLAITASEKNLTSLLSAYKAGNDYDKDLYLEALELTAGDDALVNFLQGQLAGADENLNDSLIAAISNHGSIATIDLLYEETKKSGDPDAYYDLGIGLGEVIPDRAALPRLGELASAGDEYSHLAVKALLNYGDEGLVQVIDIVNNTKDEALNAKLLADAVDHIAYDENTNEIIDEAIKSTNSEVAREVLEEAKDELDYEDYEDDDL